MKRIPNGILRTARVLYLYGDGHAVIAHERKDRMAGRIHWVTAHEKAGPDVRLASGRLIVVKEAIPMILSAKSVGAAHGAGSNATSQRSLRIVDLEIDHGAGPVYFHLFPELVSGDISWQAEAACERFDSVVEGREWGTLPVGRVYPA
jgi:hypothetical protein